MVTRKGKALDLLGSDETILWNSTRLSKGSSRRGCIHLYLLIAAPWALFVILIFASGMIPFSPVAVLFFMLMMIPFWLYFFMLAYDKFDASHTFYYVTNKGIYIQKCAFPPETDFYSFDEFESAEPSENAMYVECRLKEPQIYYGKGKPRENWEILLEPESNRRDAAGIIQEQIEKLQRLGAAADSPFPLRTDLPAEKNVTGTAVIDAGQAFFADLKHKRSTVKNRGDFLDESATADTAAMKQPAADDFSQLQHELFGDEALQTQASPDPTVYPLSKLPDETNHTDESAQLMQLGE